MRFPGIVCVLPGSLLLVNTTAHVIFLTDINVLIKILWNWKQMDCKVVMIMYFSADKYSVTFYIDVLSFNIPTNSEPKFPICRSLRVMSWRHRGFTWKPRSSLTTEKTAMKLASGFCIPELLPVHTGIKGQQVHPLIRFLLRSRVDEKSADLHKAFHLCFVPGLRNGAISGVLLISDSPGHFNQESKF